jgi:hypothetical protein
MICRGLNVDFAEQFIDMLGSVDVLVDVPIHE